MKIAIIGAGFCGIATAWTFLQQMSNPVEITLFDSKKIGLGTSGIAAGLLHPFVGVHSKLNPWGMEGFLATEKLIAVAENHLGRPIADRSGMYRLAISDSQKQVFRLAANQHPSHIQWLEADEMAAKIPQACRASGIYIKTAMTVYTADYLKGLWLACQNLGARFVQHNITSLNELTHFDLIIATAGADSTYLPELKSLRLTRTKGQLLYINWPNDHAPLSSSVNSEIYCVMSPDKSYCIAGATFEKQFAADGPDQAIAESLILPKLYEMLPILKGADIRSCRAGVRAGTPNRQPLIKQISDKGWVFAGLGSKGLLYHALYAERLKEVIINSPYATCKVSY